MLKQKMLKVLKTTNLSTLYLQHYHQLFHVCFQLLDDLRGRCRGAASHGRLIPLDVHLEATIIDGVDVEGLPNMFHVCLRSKRDRGIHSPFHLVHVDLWPICIEHLMKYILVCQGAAVSLVELGEYQKASDFLEKLVKVIPDKADAYRLLGEVKFELKDYDGSSSSYRKSLSSSENIDFDVLRGLTNSLLAANKPDQAVDVILSCRQKLIEKSQTRLANLAATNDDSAPKSQDVDLIQVDLLLGKAYSNWGHISDAVAVYDNLITEHPEDFRGYLARGVILKENGKAGEAERMFIQAKFFAPDAVKALVDQYAQR
ncbi:hypothetical protein GUJ93_ZPchr0007g3665 [Zizania palustris]|uniref:Uncharacterized protein n=1 Tax=Zizania palustris TaxID=103762 RepID=A0A8J5TES7_ZIZPA|nr:hypothetical protein GUJ93_ZPchr0007g3665 [Zizania palustris]